MGCTYGIFNYAYAFVGLLAPIANLGLDNVVIRSAVNNPSNKNELLGTTFWLLFFAAIATLLLAVGSMSLLRKDEIVVISLVGIFATTWIFQAFDTIDLWFRAKVQSKYTVVAKNIAFVIATLLKVFLIKSQASLIAFAWVTLAEFILGAIGLAIAYKVSGYSLLSWRWNSKLAKGLIKESWPLIFSSLAILIYMKIDLIMLGQMAGDKAVGIYSAATRISEVWYFIPMAVASSVCPSIYAAKEVSEELYYQRIGKFLRLVVVMALVIALPMTFLSGTVVTTLFGNGYAEAGKVLAVHIWASLFVFMSIATSPWFISEGLNHLSMYRTIIGAISNVILNLFLIPTYEGFGAAIATVISYALASFLSNATDPKTLKIFQMQVKSIFMIRY
jgi:polysaccharide transporter, PST family